MHTEPPTLDAAAVADWARRLTVRLVRPAERAPGRALLARHHYLGFRGLVGEARYSVACLDDQWVALLGWEAAAWMCRARDRWTGGRGRSSGRDARLCPRSATTCAMGTPRPCGSARSPRRPPRCWPPRSCPRRSKEVP